MLVGGVDAVVFGLNDEVTSFLSDADGEESPVFNIVISAVLNEESSDDSGILIGDNNFASVVVDPEPVVVSLSAVGLDGDNSARALL